MQEPPDFSNPLLDTVRRLPAEIFAVVEGAHFDDAPAELKALGLAGRPLYLEGEKDSDVASGPHLVPIRNLYAFEKLGAMIGNKPAAVFWSWQHGAETLYRHLRTINLVEIPRENAGGPGASAYEAVVFRHADPNVLASILPLLDASQFSRLLGAAAGIVMDATDFGGVKIAPRPDNLPASPHGFLRFSKDQIAVIRQRGGERSHRRIARYLREVAPDPTDKMSDAEIHAAVLKSEKTGKEIGLHSEQAFGKWSYLNIITGGRILEQDGVRRYMTDGAHPPDQKVTLMLRSLGLAFEQLERRR
jgi:hypothetical protein